MPEVMEVEVGQAGQLTGPVKGMPDIVVAASMGIVEDPRYVLTGLESAEESPQHFIERERPCRAVIGVSQPDKPMGHVHGLPSEGQDLFLTILCATP